MLPAVACLRGQDWQQNRSERAEYEKKDNVCDDSAFMHIIKSEWMWSASV